MYLRGTDFIFLMAIIPHVAVLKSIRLYLLLSNCFVAKSNAFDLIIQQININIFIFNIHILYFSFFAKTNRQLFLQLFKIHQIVML